MSCEVEKLNGVLHIRGELTIYSAAALKDGLFAALAETADECRVDVSQVSEVDTSGLQLLIMMRRLCAAAAREFTLLDPSDALREVLELLQLDCRLRSAAVAPPAGGAA